MLNRKNFNGIISALVLFALALACNLTVGCVSHEESAIVPSGDSSLVEDGLIGESSSALCADDLIACNDTLIACNGDLTACNQGRVADSNACEAARQQAANACDISRTEDIANAIHHYDLDSVTAAEILAAPAAIGVNPDLPPWCAGGPPGIFFAVASVDHPDGSGPVAIVGAFALENLGPGW